MATGFVGQGEAKLDDKNRVSIPAKFRADFGNGAVYLMSREEGCIAMYSEESFLATRDDVKDGNSRGTLEGRAAWRRNFANTERATPDSQGRLLMPARLLARANIGFQGEVELEGCYEWLEIWPAGSRARRDAEEV